jgi:hypothetical protein
MSTVLDAIVYLCLFCIADASVERNCTSTLWALSFLPVQTTTAPSHWSMNDRRDVRTTSTSGQGNGNDSALTHDYIAVPAQS